MDEHDVKVVSYRIEPPERGVHCEKELRLRFAIAWELMQKLGPFDVRVTRRRFKPDMEERLEARIDNSFDRRSDAERASAIFELQQRARTARLAGRVVPVWPDNSGRMNFIAPDPWRPFFRSMSLQDVFVRLNKVISW
jgi:hypothetical protein